MTPSSERQAFLLWMSSSEKDERERVVIRREAISTLERAIGELGPDAAHSSSLTCTLRRWKGIVAREQANWTVARFEFLQGRNLAESYEPASVPWFDAAITETEVWEAFGKPGLELDPLKELVEKLDGISGLYGLAGDRTNEELTADWVEWFKFFLVPAIPSSALAARILDHVLLTAPRIESGEGAPRTALRAYVFMWNYFWFSALHREEESLLRSVFASKLTLEVLLRGASVLAPRPGSFEPLLTPEIYQTREFLFADSPDLLLQQIKADLDAFRSIERNAKRYISRVQELWTGTSPQKRREVERAMHPEKQRR